MRQPLHGVVEDGVIVLEEGHSLPNGTAVIVIPEEEAIFRPDWQKAWQTVGIGGDREGKTDISENVDRYLAEIHRSDASMDRHFAAYGEDLLLFPLFGTEIP